jgi:uncharacterized protein
MTQLVEIQNQVHRRTMEIEAQNHSWPCRKGCSDCCRSLASEPRIAPDEWILLFAAIESLPVETRETIYLGIRESSGAARPLTCPLLDLQTGACLVYEARPVACRAYGFYAERDKVLGCYRIEGIAAQRNEVVWGNHASLDQQLEQLGPTAPLSEWLAAEPAERTAKQVK